MKEKRLEKIGSLELPEWMGVRARNALRKLRIDSVEKLLDLNLMDVWNLRGAGVKTLEDIDSWQTKLGTGVKTLQDREYD